MKKVLLLSLLCAFFSGSIGQITMSTANCVVTANEIQMDITVTNNSLADLRWNGTVIRFTVPAAIIPAGVHTYAFSYVGSSDFPLSFPDGPGAPGAGAFYTTSTRLLSWASTPSTAYNNSSPACGAPLILPGQTKTIGRFSFKITSANFVTGQPATFTWHSTSSCNLYQACDPVVTGYVTSGLRTLATPCTINTLFDCTGVSVSGTATNALCNGSATGTIAASPIGTTGAVAYTISPAVNTSGAATGIFTGLPAGSYIISLTDANLCSVSTGSITVGQPLAVSGTENHTAIACFGGTSTVTVNAAGGNSSYTYSLNGGTAQFSNILMGVPQGNHVITITDGNGCTGSVAVNITQPSQIIPSETHTAIGCVGGNSSVTISATGGNPPYTGTGIFSQAAGTVNYTITDASGCSVVFPVTITGPSALSLPVVNVSQPTCTTLGQITVTSPAPGTGIFYSIDGINYTNATGIFTIPPVGGTFNVSYKNGSCISSSVTAVVNPQPPTPTTPGITSTNNFNGTYTLTATGVTGPVLWSTGQTTLSITVFPNIVPFTVTQSNGTCNSAPASITVANILTDPAIGNMAITNMSNVQLNTNALLFTQTYKLRFPVYNLNQVHAVPNGTTTITVNLGKRLILEPSYVLSTAPLSAYFTWSLSIVSGNQVLTGVQIQTIPPDYEDVASFNVLGSLSCTSNIHANITTTVTDEDLNNNNADLLYTFGVTVSGLPSNVTCNAANNGTITVTSSPGTTVQVTNASNIIVGTTAVTTNLPPGLYVVTATAIGDAPENEECTAFTNVIVSEPTVLTASATGTDVTCHGTNNGTATANPTGGTISYSYSWNSVPVQTTQTAIELYAGTYIVTITDAMGCVTFATVTINEPATPMTVVVSGQNVSCNGFYNGTASVSVSGGTPGYTYSWNTAPVQTTNTAIGLMAGIYTCTITDANGCIETATYEVTEADILSGAITGTEINCAGANTGTITVYSVAGGTAPYIYAIAAGPVTNTTGATTGIFTGLTAGEYFVSVTDANNCDILLTYIITEPPVLLLSVSVVPVSCFNGNNGTISATATGGIPGYTYTISPAVNTTGATSGIFTALPAGSYTVTLTDMNGCSTTQVVIVTQPSTSVSASTSGTSVLCYGGNNATATAVATGGTAPYSYLWNTVPIQTTASISNLVAGSYTVTITDANGCTASSTYIVTETTSISSVASGTNVNCHGGNNGTATAVTSGGTGPYTYTISGPTINTTGAATGIFTGLTSGIYTIISTDVNGCTASAVYTVTQPAASLSMSLVTTSGNACNQGTNGTITVTAANGTPSYTFTITSGPTINTTGATSGIFTGLTGGAYSIRCTDANGCFVNVNATVYAPAGIATDISLGSDYTSNFFVLSGVENTIMFNVTEIGGNPAVGDTIRITNIAGYIFTYDQSSTSLPMGFITYTLNNSQWKIDNSEPSFVSLIKMHPTNPVMPGTINCGTIERISLKMKRNTPNIATFTLSSRLRRANGEVNLLNNLSSIIFTAE